MARLRCEHNYAVSYYVAEFFNCFSNLAIVAAGLLGLRNALRHGYPRRVLVLYTAITVIGLGSAAFHGTLTHEGQQGDETPMVWGIIIWCWCLVFFDPAREDEKTWSRRLQACKERSGKPMFTTLPVEASKV